MPARPTTIDEYLAALPDAQRVALERLRKQIVAAAPGAEEYIGYGVPAFRLNGRPLIYFGAAKNHCAIYGANDSAALAAKLARYEQGKGTIQFSPSDPIPAALVREIVKTRVAANAERWGAKVAKKRTKATAARAPKRPTT